MGTRPCSECAVDDGVMAKSSLAASEAASPIIGEKSGLAGRDKVLWFAHTSAFPFPAQA